MRSQSWRSVTQCMARQPGFVSISLHRSLDGHRIVNYIQWENRDFLLMGSAVLQTFESNGVNSTN